jgi:hypothetical protein
VSECNEVAFPIGSSLCLFGGFQSRSIDEPETSRLRCCAIRLVRDTERVVNRGEN